MQSDVIEDTANALPDRVRGTIRIHAMIETGDRVLAAVSGGPDSVCLLYVLQELGVSLEVAHLDHVTRAGASAADAEFVRELAGRLGVPFHVERCPVEAEARQAGRSFEEHARRTRYAFLKRIATERGCAEVATGHHADDCVETILMRLLRGTTPSGLAGIPPVRQQDGVRIIRPLIDCTRDQILAYLEARGLPYRLDSTNTETRYLRNRIRHELLPNLARDYNPQVRDALLRLAEAQRCDQDFFDTLADSRFMACCTFEAGIDRAAFGALHPALQRRVLLRAAWRHGVDCPFARVVDAARFVAAGPTGQRFDLGEGVTLRNGRAVTEILSGVARATDLAEVALEVPGTTRAFDCVFTVRLRDEGPRTDLARFCTPQRQVFDADALGTALTVRRRRPGDRFTPYGMTGTRKLQDYFVDLGVPVGQRDSQLLLVAGGRIAWIVGRAIDAHGAVSPQTRRVLEIEVSPCD